jgi:PST family polysaccharide transporter
MIVKFKALVRRNEKMIKNFSFLSLLQLFNLVSPLIAYPFLIMKFGKETYGLVIFSQAIVGYLVILIAFGFNVIATKEVSIHRNDKNKLSEIVSSVLIIKIILFIISFIILVGLLFFVKQAQDYKILFYLTMWLGVYEVLFPQFYFQGIEQMKYITYITLVSRILFLALIFLIIKSPGDYLYYPIINGLGAVLAGVISLYIVFWKHKIIFKFQTINKLLFYLKEAFTIFVSTVSINLYKGTNKVVIGTFLGMGDVAIYDLAEKVVTILKIPQNILSQTVFPKISREKNMIFIKKIFKISVLFNIVIFILALFFTKTIVSLIGGAQMIPATIIVYILGATVPLLAMGNIFGFQSLIVFGYNKAFTKVVVMVSILYFVMLILLWLTFGFSIIKISIITLIIEIISTVSLFILCKKYKIW